MNTSQNSIEQSRPSSHIEAKNNLSETARFVKPYLDTITQDLRADGSIQQANEIFALKLPEDNPKVIEMVLKLKEKQGAVIEGYQANGTPDKGIAVVNNFFNRLIDNLRNAA